MKLMRQSTINQACQLRVHMDRVAPKHRGSEIRAVGTGYHKAMEIYYSSGGEATATELAEGAIKALDAEVNAATDGFDWDTDREGAQVRMMKLINHVIEGGHTWDLNDYIVLGTEVEFNFPWYHDWVAHGTIDLILMSKEDGWLYFVDHKTAGSKWREGKQKPRQTAQPVWYTHFGREWFYSQYGEWRDGLFYFDVAHTTKSKGTVGFNRYPATFSEDQAAQVFTKAMDLAKLLDRDGPFLPNQTHYLCDHRWCDQWYACPYGETFNNH